VSDEDPVATLLNRLAQREHDALVAEHRRALEAGQALGLAGNPVRGRPRVKFHLVPPIPRGDEPRSRAWSR
jgi:hypothetical protein